MDDIGDTIGNRVPKEAKLRLRNARALARIAGLSHSHIRRVLRGEKGANAHTLAVIAQAADVRLDHLYNFILLSPHLKIKSRKKRRPRARSVITPISKGEVFPEKGTPPKESIPHKKKVILL